MSEHEPEIPKKKKKEWVPPTLTVLEIEQDTRGGAPPGASDGGGGYS